MKIIGGNQTGVNEYPMVAGIVLNEKTLEKENLICGATVISSQYVVTAAHCVLKSTPKQLKVLIGDHNIDSGNIT